jgi:hypothetical protein
MQNLTFVEGSAELPDREDKEANSVEFYNQVPWNARREPEIRGNTRTKRNPNTLISYR